jgi:predicted nuclease with TOPRIM domain
MSGTNAEVQFASQMEFLKAYATTFEQKKELKLKLEERLSTLKTSVEEFEKLESELDNLKKSLREDEKFLISMNDMVLRNTGQPISNGDLFEQHN